MESRAQVFYLVIGRHSFVVMPLMIVMIVEKYVAQMHVCVYIRIHCFLICFFSYRTWDMKQKLRHQNVIFRTAAGNGETAEDALKQFQALAPDAETISPR